MYVVTCINFKSTFILQHCSDITLLKQYKPILNQYYSSITIDKYYFDTLASAILTFSIEGLCSASYGLKFCSFRIILLIFKTLWNDLFYYIHMYIHTSYTYICIATYIGYLAKYHIIMCFWILYDYHTVYNICMNINAIYVCMLDIIGICTDNKLLYQ